MSDLYFDYAAATPLDDEVLQAMQPFYSRQFYNPSALYGAATEVRAALEAARAQVAAVLGARPNEIVFTAGGTEANNLAIQGVLRRFTDGNVVVSAIEHESVLAPAGKFSRRVAPVLPDGRVDLSELEKLIDDNTVLVSIMQANNEIGTIQPIREIGAILNKIRTSRQAAGNARPLYFHTDACQAANYLDVHVHRLGVDLLTLNGGKIYGPKQSGALYVRAGIELEPLVYGGGQERGLRSGTENVVQAVGLAAALTKASQLRESEGRRLMALRDQLLQAVEQVVPGVIINGSRKHRLPNNVHFTVPGADNERLLYLLDEHGAQVATGSACSASSQEPSHVLEAIGMAEADIRASLRLTMGRHTTQDSIQKLLEILAAVV